MQTELILAGAVAGFLVLFWFTPAGIPTLKRFGAGEVSPDLRLHYGAEETYRLLDLYGPKRRRALAPHAVARHDFPGGLRGAVGDAGDGLGRMGRCRTGLAIPRGELSNPGGGQ